MASREAVALAEELEPLLRRADRYQRLQELGFLADRIESSS
jgi:hypothetical protein